MNLGETIQASKRAWDRKDSDFYPTPEETTEALCRYIGKERPMRIREPCCGEGHISEVLKAHGHDVTSSDIRHTGYGQGGIDYLKLPESNPEFYDFEAVITNPPFAVADAIIRRALRDAPIVAMLLSNNYWHAASRLKLFQTRKPAAVLPLTWRPAFLEAERGSSPIANMQWTIWIDDQSVTETLYIPQAKPVSYPPGLEVTSEVEIGRTGLLGDLIEAFEARLAPV